MTVYRFADIIVGVKPKSMYAIIQSTFAESGLSIKRLAEETKLPYSVAHGAVTGSSDPCLSTVQRICDRLGLELRRTRKSQRKN